MFAAKTSDLLVGLCMHYEMVPMPAPTPTPLPMPFIAMLSDAAQGVAEAMTDAMCAAGGKPPVGLPMMVNSLPAVNVGVVAKNATALPHIPMPPGVAFAPMPKSPMSQCGRMTEPPPPDSPAMPAGNALLNAGCQAVAFGLGKMVHMGDQAQCCSEASRQTANAIAVPAGFPVLIMA